MKWISVKDRLPDISDRYAVCYKHGDLPLKRFIADFDDIDGWHMPVPDTEITHWMPLPEAPEGRYER